MSDNIVEFDSDEFEILNFRSGATFPDNLAFYLLDENKNIIHRYSKKFILILKIYYINRIIK